MMFWIWIASAAASGYYVGLYQAKVQTVVDNRTKIEGAGEIFTGIQKVFS